MTREQEINLIADCAVPDDKYKEFKDGIIWGAKWADKHPKDGMVSLDKVVKYLQSKLEYSPDIDGLQIYDTGIEEFINDFCKAMEE